MPKLKDIRDLERLRESLVAQRDEKTPLMIISNGTCGRAKGSHKVVEKALDIIEKRGLEGKIKCRATGCIGFCEVEPNIVVQPQGIFYVRVTPEDVERIIDETLLEGKIIDELIYTDPQTGEKIPYYKDIPFYRAQMPLILGNNLLVDPESIEDYIAIGGYAALAKVLSSMSPEEVIEEIKRSGLRGRGGGGFPTGRKWESCRRAKGDIKYVICNADEGDPGAYMDRSVLEGNPHSVLEGMIIGAYAIGTSEGYIYVREEYPLARKHFGKALESAREYGFLGENILGTGFSFDVRISVGGGAFVCGESTALMASIEGKPGEPRPKHIHTVERGLWNKPTTLNNVETWANVPLIINRGAEWYAQIGTEGSKGTKIFSLVGKVKNTGLVEVPMGTTLREIIFDIGGGIRGDKKFKAVQTGGPSGGLIPEKFLDTPVDFDELTKLGSMMGSGGMIVLDEDNCVVDVAKYFINFLKDESCGKCFPCREGLVQLSHILERITAGEGEEEDLEKLEDLCWLMKNTCLCELGKSAPNPLLTAMKYFPDEFEAHIKDKRCPSGVCRALITIVIDPELCTGCTLCARKCPAGAISGEPGKPHEIDQEKCTKCKLCVGVCKVGAVRVE